MAASLRSSASTASSKSASQALTRFSMRSPSSIRRTQNLSAFLSETPSSRALRTPPLLPRRSACPLRSCRRSLGGNAPRRGVCAGSLYEARSPYPAYSAPPSRGRTVSPRGGGRRRFDVEGGDIMGRAGEGSHQGFAPISALPVTRMRMVPTASFESMRAYCDPASRSTCR